MKDKEFEKILKEKDWGKKFNMLLNYSKKQYEDKNIFDRSNKG
jgi:hypothetical protein